MLGLYKLARDLNVSESVEERFLLQNGNCPFSKQPNFFDIALDKK